MKTIDRNPIQHKVMQLRETLGITQEEAAHLVGVASTTLSRWANQRSHRLDAVHEARLDSLLNILAEAKEAIRPEGISWWFKEPNPQLSDLRPIDLLHSASGTQKVQMLLGAMRWGLPI